jgi:hypothetical protein
MIKKYIKNKIKILNKKSKAIGKQQKMGCIKYKQF